MPKTVHIYAAGLWLEQKPTLSGVVQYMHRNDIITCANARLSGGEELQQEV